MSQAGVVVDPGDIAISTAPHQQGSPALAFDGNNYLVVFEDSRGGPDSVQLFGARVTPAGTVLDPGGLPLVVSAWSKVRPVTAFDGTNYLVAWGDYRGDPNRSKIFAARISPLGPNLDGTGVQLSSATIADSFAARLAFDGTNYLAVWFDTGNNLPNRVRGAEVTPALTLVGGSDFPISAGPSELGEDAPEVAGGGGRFLVAYHWFDQGGSAFRIHARFVGDGAANGAACTLGSQCLSSSCSDGVCCDVPCGGGDPSDCRACSVAAGAMVDGTCAPLRRGTVCRPSAGVCDVAESCDGTATTCRGDSFLPATTVCRPAAGPCDSPEHCTGASAACPADTCPNGCGCRPSGARCSMANDCASSVCTPTTLTSPTYCRAPSCGDGIKNGDESGVDCGGPCGGFFNECCPRCVAGGSCAAGSDCASRVCGGDGICRAPSCTDGVKNGDESDVDCGGSCLDRCQSGQRCGLAGDCRSLLCTAGYCRVPATCTNHHLDPGETGVDCGGPCAPCGSGVHCLVNADCHSRMCMAGICS